MILNIVKSRFPELEAIGGKFSHCLYTGHVTNNGEYVQRFEEKLAEYLGVPTLAFNNGQTALISMLMAAGIGRGDHVLVPSFTFCGTIAAIKLLGAIPVYVDIDETLTVDLKSIETQLKRSVSFKAILGVDVYGICCDYEGITEIAHEHGLVSLFDSAPAFGSMPYTKPTGRHGDAQIFSFHATKPFSTMEGGALCSNDPIFMGIAKEIRDFGQDENRVCHRVGLNGKMMEVCALIGLENLKGWQEYRHGKTLRAQTVFGPNLQDIDGVETVKLDDGQWPIWTYYPILVTEKFGKSRDEVLKHLNSKHIMARTYYPACHLMKPFANGQKLPVTERVAEQVIALPFYADMLNEEMSYIVEAIKEVA